MSSMVSRKKFEIMISSLNSVIERYNEQHKAGFDFGTGDLLFPAEIHTLQFIGNNPQTTITSLSENFEVTKATISERVKKLYEKDLVKKKKSPYSGREILIELTDLGKIAYNGHEKHHARLFRIFCDFFGNKADKKADEFNNTFNEYLEMMDYVQKIIQG